MPLINLGVLPKGMTYEHTYGSWLEIFRTVAESYDKPSILNAPPSWAPFLNYLGATVISLKEHFEEDRLTDFLPLDLLSIEARGMLRELVEAYSTLRPELVDALYKSDVEWSTIGRRHQPRKHQFNVTCNGSFFRREILDYFTLLAEYRQSKKKCVLVPCAADKPYPAPMHKAVRDNITDEYEIIIATGVLGLVPESLWGQMPEYDSGLPYQWRLMEIAREFFSKHHYDHIIVYSDFYASAIDVGLSQAGVDRSNVVFIFEPSKVYTSYENLLDEESLKKLHEAVQR